MKLPVLSVDEVADARLCCGCGACEGVGDGQIRMVDSFEFGRRPVVAPDASAEVRASALSVCPGIVSERPDGTGETYIRRLRAMWGPILEVHEGWASDAEVRFLGSSGGITTALSLFALEEAGMAGVVHTRAKQDQPYLNETVLSRTRESLLAATGSRYSPASPCDGIPLIEKSNGPCVFVGKPCDVEAINRAAALRAGLGANLGLTIAFFCAGTPTTRGTLEMLEAMGVDDPAQLASLRYRGRGWPGGSEATLEGPSGERRSMSYEQAWDTILTRHKQWRCNLCADHVGEHADISVGDAWHRPRHADEPGRSLILLRTARGRAFFERAVAAGYVESAATDPSCLEAAQPWLARATASVCGRSVTLRALGIVTPKIRRKPLFRLWLTRLSVRDKLRSVAGTIRRVSTRGLRVRESSHAQPVH